MLWPHHGDQEDCSLRRRGQPCKASAKPESAWTVSCLLSGGARVSQRNTACFLEPGLESDQGPGLFPCTQSSSGEWSSSNLQKGFRSLLRCYAKSVSRSLIYVCRHSYSPLQLSLCLSSKQTQVRKHQSPTVSCLKQGHVSLSGIQNSGLPGVEAAAVSPKGSFPTCCWTLPSRQEVLDTLSLQ